MSATLVAPRRGSLTLILVGFAAAAVGAVWLAAPAPAPVGGWVAFAAATALGELLVIDNPRGRAVPTSGAVLGAFALLGNPPWSLALMAAVGWAVGALVRRSRREHVEVLELAERVVGGWALGGFAAVGSLVGGPEVGTGTHPITIAAIVGVTTWLILGPALWEAAGRAPVHGGDLEKLLVGQLYETWSPSLALASSAALAAVAHEVLGDGALALMLLPILAARAGLHRYTGIRRTYDQTVVAMSRMSELGGHIGPGHGIRVGEVAVAVARELSLPEREVAVIQRAAHLHEVGRISTDDAHRSADDHEVAVTGAHLLREAGMVEEVADIVARHRDPYRHVNSGDDASLSTAARIVHSACEFDRLASSRGRRDPWLALDALHRGMAYDHDPLVVNALVRVVERRAT